jgi:hypothetical protein
VRRGLAGMVWILALSQPAQALPQDCFPGANSNEAKTLGIVAVPLAFGRAAAPSRFYGFQAGVELVYLPHVDAATATPTICNPGKGPENTDPISVLPRPRIGLPLPLGLSLQASWIPPVRFQGVKANLFGISLEKAFGSLDGLVAALRAHASFGTIRAPITCDNRSLQDASSECFGGTRSDDRLQPNIMGADLSVGGPLAGGRLRPYGGLGYNRLQPRFRVNFINRFGDLDNRKVSVDLDRFVVFGGATWLASARVGVSGELYAAPSDAITGRIVMRASVGP